LYLQIREKGKLGQTNCSTQKSWFKLKGAQWPRGDLGRKEGKGEKLSQKTGGANPKEGQGERGGGNPCNQDLGRCPRFSEGLRGDVYNWKGTKNEQTNVKKVPGKRQKEEKTIVTLIKRKT